MHIELKDRIVDTLYDYSTWVLLLIVILGSVWWFVPPASARCEVLMPGDFVYLNETCDVSRVVSWGGMFAHFPGEYYSDNPDRIVNITGFMYTHFIDPNKYVVGNWYKWEGSYEANGYNLAFIVKSGKRPNVTANVTTNITPTPKPTMEIKRINTDMLLARGEQYEYTYNSTYKGDAWLWMFTPDNAYMGVPLEYYNGYNYLFTPELTQSLVPDVYTEYIQFAGNNSRQDIYYKDGGLQSLYRDIPSVYIAGNYSYLQVPDLFLKMEKNPLSDDIVVPLRTTIEEPSIIIKNYYRDGDTIIVQGNTSLSFDTKINCIIDPDHWTTQTEKRANTYPVTMMGDIEHERTFIVRLPLNWDELSIGEHNIVLSAQNGLINLTAHKEFKVTDTYVMPSPTPEKVKIALDDNGTPLVTAIPSPTPTPEPTTIEPTPTPDPTIEPNFTANVTIPTPTPEPTPTPKPIPTMYTLDLPANICVVALCIAFAKLRGHL